MPRNRSRLAFPISLLVLAAILCANTRVLAQDAQAWADDYVKKVDAEVALYLQQHPVRPSPIFDAVSKALRELGKNDAWALERCRFHPLFKDWEDEFAGLRENTMVALRASYMGGKRIYHEGMPAGSELEDRALCGHATRVYHFYSRNLKLMGKDLRREGY